ncbi:MAG: ATP-binding protein [Cyanobacteriota bacterium]|nr:ATP-binding protein [Cyanobacteriota bacterium]
MTLDLYRFFQASNPAKTLEVAKDDDRQYYIDFSSVRGGNIIEELKRTITRLSPNSPTSQLFTGHIGCGKSTELLRLKTELEEEGFHVVYFESSQDLNMADVDITDILLAIARQVSESIEKLQIKLQPRGFKALLKGVYEVLNTEIDLSGEANVPGIGTISGNTEGEFSLALGIGKITAKTKAAPNLRAQLRQYLEPRTNNILEAINKELLDPANQQLKQLGKKSLVVIIDNLDRISNQPGPTGRPQPEYLFVDRGEQLNKLNCHVVYTIPLILIFSNDLGQLTNRFGVEPKLLPMVPVQLSDSTDCEEGLALLQQMVLARAFPQIKDFQERLQLVSTIFDSPETLDRMCRVSGGHLRQLLVLLYTCLQKQDPPILRASLESVITQRRHQLTRAIDPHEWELLRQVARTKSVSGENEYQTLLSSLFVFEYRYADDLWFDSTPILKEAKEFKGNR